MKVSPEIASLEPYPPGKPISEAKRELGLAQVIKLASNENALGPSLKALAAMDAAKKEIYFYPDARCYDLTQKLADRRQLDPNWILIGNGSNEIIDLLIRVFCNPGDCILTSQAAFIAYKICAQAARIKTWEAPLTANYGFDVDKLLAFGRQHQPRLVFLPNPNNPTGTYLNSAAMEKLLSEWGNREDLLVVLDEAYLDYVRAKDFTPAHSLLKKYSNVAVLHTFSKVYALAGLRVGVLYAPPEVTGYLHRVRNPFNVNSLGQVAAIAALNDEEHVRRSVELVWQGLDYFYSELTRLKLPFIKSQGNFVLFDCGRDSTQVFSELLKKGVVLRPVKPYGLPRHLRMTAGTMDENRTAIRAIEEVLRP